MSLLAIHRIFRLGVYVFMLVGVTACDDAPETPAQKSIEVKKELDKRLLQTASESAPFTVQSLEMQVNGQTVTLSTAEKDKIIALGTALCDFNGKAGEASKGKVKQALKVKTDKLISTLLDMGILRLQSKSQMVKMAATPKNKFISIGKARTKKLRV